MSSLETLAAAHATIAIGLDPAVETDRLILTPPGDLRTDPGRGTGELGSEGSDRSKPLAAAPLPLVEPDRAAQFS